MRPANSEHYIESVPSPIPARIERRQAGQDRRAQGRREAGQERHPEHNRRRQVDRRKPFRPAEFQV
jgi:hypothetical protein